MKIVYITPFVNEAFFNEVKRGMSDAARIMGVDASFTGVADADCGGLEALLKDALDEKVDGITLSFPHPTRLNAIVHRIIDSGIPLVSFNMDAPESGRLATVAQDFYRAGRTLGHRAAIHLPEGAHVLTTVHDAHVPALEERLRGIRDALVDKRLVLDSIVSGNTPESARATIRKAIGGDTVAVLCTGQSDTHGAGLVARELSGTRGLYVAGFDVCPEICELLDLGFLDATIDQQPYVQGFYPLCMLVHYLTQGVLPFDIDTGARVLTKKQC
jgi:simple sugar transport system substrate-binding protein